MAKLVSDVLNLVRDSIDDPMAARMDGDMAVRAFNRTMNRLYTERPDIFVTGLGGASLATPPVDLQFGSAVPYEDQYAQLHADMIVSEIETTSDEEADQARAALFDARSHR